MTRVPALAGVVALVSVMIVGIVPASADPIDDQVRSAGDQASLALERVAQARSEHAAVSAKAEEVRARLAGARERHEQLRDRVDSSRERLRVYVRALFRSDTSGLGQIAPLLSAETPAELIEGATLLEVATGHQNELLTSVSAETARAAKLAEETRRLAETLVDLEGRARDALDRAAAEQLVVGDLVARLQLDLAMRDAARAAAAGGLGGIPAQTPVAAGECQGALVTAYPNGQIPASLLCPLLGSGQRLRADAAAAFNKLSRSYALEFRTPICVSSAYRSFDEQVAVKASRGSLAAAPGRSNHGWGLAVDLCGGINAFGTAQHNWMRANAPIHGFYHPSWAQQGGSKPEPWHWEYAGTGALASGVPFMPPLPGDADVAPPEDEAEPQGPAEGPPPSEPVAEPPPPPSPAPTDPAPQDPAPQDPPPQEPTPPEPTPSSSPSGPSPQPAP